MDDIIRIVLAVIALYCFGMWGYYAYLSYRFREVLSDDASEAIGTFTFRAGLCGILCLGFLLIGD